MIDFVSRQDSSDLFCPESIYFSNTHYEWASVLKNLRIHLNLQVYNLQREVQKKEHQLGELRKQIDEQELRKEEMTKVDEDGDRQMEDKDLEKS